MTKGKKDPSSSGKNGPEVKTRSAPIKKEEEKTRQEENKIRKNKKLLIEYYLEEHEKYYHLLVLLLCGCNQQLSPHCATKYTVDIWNINASMAYTIFYHVNDDSVLIEFLNGHRYQSSQN